MSGEPAGLDAFLGEAPEASRDPASLKVIPKAAPEPVGIDNFLADQNPGEPAGLDQFLSSDTHGTPGQQVLAGVEGAARGLTLGGSDVVERGLGLAKPEDMAARARENPWTSTLAGMGGAGVLGALTGGGSLIAEGLGGGALAGAVGLGTEGAVFGAGNAVSEAALGDGQLNGEKLLSHMGWGAALGGGLGAVAGKLGAFEGRLAELPAGAIEGSGAPVMEMGEAPAGPVKDYADLQSRIAKAQANGLTYELPQKAAVLDAASRLPDLEIPLLPQQAEALNSHADFDGYRIKYREGDGEASRLVQNAEAIQKADIVRKTDQAIESLSPNVTPTADAVTAGNRAAEAFTEQYHAEKNALVPMFRALEKVDLGPIRADIMPLMDKFAEKIPAVARIFDFADDGTIKGVESFDPKWGIARSAYNSVKDVYKSLEAGAEDPASFQDLLNLRGNLDEHVNILAKDQGPAQIRGLKAAFMDYLQGLAEDHIPDANLRDTFKRYAVNEQNRQIIERTFGSSVGSKDLQFMPRAAAEDVLGKMFRDTATVAAAKRILDPAKFDELLANHLSQVKQSFTKNGVFSSNNFLNFMRRHQAELGAAFEAQPGVLQRLKDLTTLSTIIPDAPRVNPSGTAKTVLGLLKDIQPAEVGLGIFHPITFASLYGQKAAELWKESRAGARAIVELNNGLMGKAIKQKSLEVTQKALEAVTANLDRAVKGIFRSEEPDHAR